MSQLNNQKVADTLTWADKCMDIDSTLLYKAVNGQKIALNLAFTISGGAVSLLIKGNA